LLIDTLKKYVSSFSDGLKHAHRDSCSAGTWPPAPRLGLQLPLWRLAVLLLMRQPPLKLTLMMLSMFTRVLLEGVGRMMAAMTLWISALMKANCSKYSATRNSHKKTCAHDV
jgi:hypothetical protein